ncbi:MAG: DsbA family protein [Candidatus Omnitrophica bacterium]|nr:DsbA family protein [Candidatus Omnitrophota bacterium]
MQNRNVILSMIVIGAIVIGVSMAVNQANSPIMRQLVEQQKEILQLQRQLSGTGTGAPSSVDQKLVSLEKKVDSLLKIFQMLGAPVGGSAEPSEDLTKVHQIDIGKSHVRGNKEAPITIVEFVDFQCPYCARFHPVLNEVLAEYPDQVNYILKNFPLEFHQQAKGAAKAALAAGEQGKYWEMAELIFKNQRSLNKEKFEELAKEVGLNVEKFREDLEKKDAEWEKIIEEDLKLGQQVEVQGTPTFYINGRKTMARSKEEYKKAIEEILNPKPKVEENAQNPKGE